MSIAAFLSLKKTTKLPVTFWDGFLVSRVIKEPVVEFDAG